MSLVGEGLPNTLKSRYTTVTFQLTMGQYYPSLESLHIDCGSLLCLPLQLLPKLKDLHIYYCKNLESLSAIEVSLRDLTSLELHE